MIKFISYLNVLHATITTYWTGIELSVKTKQKLKCSFFKVKLEWAFMSLPLTRPWMRSSDAWCVASFQNRDCRRPPRLASSTSWTQCVATTSRHLHFLMSRSPTTDSSLETVRSWTTMTETFSLQVAVSFSKMLPLPVAELCERRQCLDATT